MTVLYGPIESKVFQYTCLDFYEWLPTLHNFVLIYNDGKGKNCLVLRDKKRILRVFPEYADQDQKEYLIRNLLKCILPSSQEERFSAANLDDRLIARSPYLQTYYLKHMKRMQLPFKLPTCVHLHGQLLWFKSFARLINYY
jgi:hypothetical protein